MYLQGNEQYLHGTPSCSQRLPSTIHDHFEKKQPPQLVLGSLPQVTCAGQIAGEVLVLRAHCVGTACILRTQRLGYSPK